MVEGAVIIGVIVGWIALRMLILPLVGVPT